MSPRCIIKACLSNLYKGQVPDGVTLVRFPEILELRETWHLACGVPAQYATKNPFICSLHFDESDFEVKSGRKYIKPRAVPRNSLAAKNPSKRNTTVLNDGNPPPLVPIKRAKADTTVKKENILPFRSSVTNQSSSRPPLKSIHNTSPLRLQNPKQTVSENLGSPHRHITCPSAVPHTLAKGIDDLIGSSPRDAPESASLNLELLEPLDLSKRCSSKVSPDKEITPIAKPIIASASAPSLVFGPRSRIYGRVTCPSPLKSVRTVTAAIRPHGVTPVTTPLSTKRNYLEIQQENRPNKSDIPLSINKPLTVRKISFMDTPVSTSPPHPKWINSSSMPQTMVPLQSMLPGLAIAQQSKASMTIESYTDSNKIHKTSQDENLIEKLQKENVALKLRNKILEEEKAKLESTVVGKDKKIRSLRQKIRRMKATVLRRIQAANIRSANDRANFIKIKRCATDSAILAILRRMNREENGPYSDPDLRAFALTLHFYSPAAYRYLREKFKNALPCERTLRTWYSATDGKPGFTEESFETLRSLSEEEKSKLHVSLMLDDMSLKKKLDIVQGEVFGYVDLGVDPETVKGLARKPKKNKNEKNVKEGQQLATDVCVFMVVCLNQSFKIPVGYFLHDKLNGEQQAILIRQCIKDLYEVGVVVRALISDGATANRKMAKVLGADINPVTIKSHSTMGSVVELRKFKPYFIHPLDASVKVYIILDVCHMLKLIRNALAGRKVIKDPDGKFVSWHDIAALHALQMKEGLRLGNRLTNRHIKWFSNKMKVTFAAQTLSRSVADALKFCELLGLPQFEGASSTAQFVNIFNDLFDVLNSHKRFAPGLKAALCEKNEEQWTAVFERAKSYILGLKIKDPKEKNYHSVFKSKRKVGFQGFMVAMESIKGLYNDLVKSGELQFLCTFKLSQDHLESFFGKIRQRSGCNNNPSSFLFSSSYKRLLLHTEIKASTAANVLQQEKIKILSVSKTGKAVTELRNSRKEISLKNKSKALHEFISLGTLFGCYSDPFLSNLSEVGKAVVSYISGFVVKRLLKKIKCSTCTTALSCSKDSTDSGDTVGFITFKSINDKLLIPTKDVVLICTLAEEAVRRACSSKAAPQVRKVVKMGPNAIADICYEAMIAGAFSELQNQLHLDGTPAKHIPELIYQVCRKYYAIRSYHMCRITNDFNLNKAIRHKLNKLILFNNQ